MQPTNPFAFGQLESPITSTGSPNPILQVYWTSFTLSSHPTMVSQTTTIDDIFDSTLTLEETHLHDGYTAGYDDGQISGKEEGRQVGLKVGFQVGEELGFYRGCVDVWNAAIRVDPTRFSSRIQKSIQTMEELLKKFPILEPEDESIHGITNSLRLKFRAICATLGVKLEYNGYPKSDVQDVGF